MYKNCVKRIIDFCCALLALIVLMPVLLIIAALVRNKLGTPILFIQDRPGKNGKIFKLMKFRTMTDARDEAGNLLPDDVRLTRFGRILRSTSLDELPELINILKGDMAVVGPRPLLVEYLPYYTDEEFHRHDVRPGLTGWAQVNGRNSTNWDERLQQDIYYVKNISFLLDAKIIFMTAFKVIKCSDILVGKQIPAGRLDNARKMRSSLKSNIVTIRKFEEKDIPNKIKWINDSANNQYLHYDIPLNEVKTRTWFIENQNRKDRYDAVIECDGIPVGIIGLLSIENGKAEYYITMGESKYKGKGVAKQASILLLDYGFNVLRLNEIYLYTEVDNIAAQKLFEKCGFVQRDKEKNSATNQGKSVDRFYYMLEVKER